MVMLHFGKAAAVSRANQLDSVLRTQAGFLRKGYIQRLIPCKIAQVQAFHLGLQLGALLFRGAGILLFQIMVTDIDFLHILLRLLILLAVTFQQLFQNAVFMFQMLDAAI